MNNNPRLSPHDAYTRRTQILGKPGKELFVNIRTTKCSHGKCKFCGLLYTEEKNAQPLSGKEFISQLENAYSKMKKEKSDIRKVSLICNSHSVIAEDIICKKALFEGIRGIGKMFPAAEIFSFETRMDAVDEVLLARMENFLSHLNLGMEIASGIETPNEKLRNELGKNLSDKTIFEFAKMLDCLGIAFRGYFIYGLLGPDSKNDLQRGLPPLKDEPVAKLLENAADFLRTPSTTPPAWLEVVRNPSSMAEGTGKPMDSAMWGNGNKRHFPNEIMDAAKFMGRIRENYDLSLSIFLVALYTPQELCETALFKTCSPIREEKFLLDLFWPAIFAKKHDILVEVDTTTSDQEITSAKYALSEKFNKAVERFNQMQSISPLIDYFRKNPDS